MELKPFIKWAGGKTQLLKEITKRYPFKDKSITKYIEPFIGSGAVLFDILSKYELKEVYISDINSSLINTYKVIKEKCKDLIKELEILENKYNDLTEEEQKTYFLDKRTKFNELKIQELNNSIEEASLFIFLNKTCFNGLYRVNKKGLFNVPFGKHKKIKICDEINLKNLSEKLKCVVIKRAEYKEAIDFIDANTFVYLDPPYRPLNKTASFTSYTNTEFNDKEQRELKEFVDEINKKGGKFLLSNSDPKNTNKNDEFFDELYKEYKIERIYASRMINSKGDKRGKITEILVSNY